MNSKITIRSYSEADAPSLVAIYFYTIHNVNTKDYSTEQVNAWAPSTSLEIDGWEYKSINPTPHFHHMGMGFLGLVNESTKITKFSHDPDVVLMIPKTIKELLVTINNFTKQHQKKENNTKLKFYCICIEGNPDNESIMSKANELGISVFHINKADLFTNPNTDASLGVDAARDFVENIMGNGVANILNEVAGYIHAQLEQEKNETISHQSLQKR